MPVEIKELVIKTEITTGTQYMRQSMDHEEIARLKDEIMNACKRMIHEHTKKTNFKR